MTDETLYKSGDAVPKAGKYVCTVCGFEIMHLEKHMAYNVTFPDCPVCKSTGEKEFWKAID